MGIFILMMLCLLCLEKQAQAEDLYPEQTGAGLQTELPSPSSFTTFNDPTNIVITSDGTPNGNDIVWFKEHIADRYGFVMDDSKLEWKSQGDFSEHLGKAEFEDAAKRALAFFQRNSDWVQTKAEFITEKDGKKTCERLLCITAARYLLVTYILRKESVNELIRCQKTLDGLTKIPGSVCYPSPPGSATCTSDHDVGLIGKDSGNLVKKFNDYFEGTFKKTSETVFDTNVYAYSLEHAMPQIFFGLPKNFAKSVVEKQNEVRFKMEELASAYYKVYKYDEPFFKKLMDTAKDTLQHTAAQGFNEWEEKFRKQNEENSLKGENIRERHNRVYESKLKEICDRGGYIDKAEINLESLAVAEIYAAEAYHTRGAIRHIVGGLQMECPDYSVDKLPMIDLWVSMIENWGETLKEYNHNGCISNKLEFCLPKMSKYMWRMLAAMKMLAERIRKCETPDGQGVTLTKLDAKFVSFEGNDSEDPEAIAKHWFNNYKKKNLDLDVGVEMEKITNFFKRFECQDININNSLLPQCISTMCDKVNEYNKKLAELFTKEHK